MICVFAKRYVAEAATSFSVADLKMVSNLSPRAVQAATQASATRLSKRPYSTATAPESDLRTEETFCMRAVMMNPTRIQSRTTCGRAEINISLINVNNHLPPQPNINSYSFRLICVISRM